MSLKAAVRYPSYARSSLLEPKSMIPSCTGIGVVSTVVSSVVSSGLLESMMFPSSFWRDRVDSTPGGDTVQPVATRRLIATTDAANARI